MAQKPGKNSIDNLMMSFADLSGSNKASSFKGPALKDVKVQRSAKTSFQPSQKARDWSSLEQSLESAFSVQQQEKFQKEQIHQRGQTEEWGSFQETSNIPNMGQNVPKMGQNVPNMGQNVPNIGHNVPNMGHNVPDMGQNVPTMSQILPNVGQALPNLGQDTSSIEFAANFTTPNAANFVQSTPVLEPNMPNIGQNLATTDEDEFADFVGPNAIGSRLATFQEESPVHKFKPKSETDFPTSQVNFTMKFPNVHRAQSI